MFAPYRTHRGGYRREPLDRGAKKGFFLASPSQESASWKSLKKLGTFCLVFVRHWDMACLELNHWCLLPSAVCVQRFGNWKVLQLIPLIALCCVLQRNGKPSHPSRHVVWAVVNRGWAANLLLLGFFVIQPMCFLWEGGLCGGALDAVLLAREMLVADWLIENSVPIFVVFFEGVGRSVQQKGKGLAGSFLCSTQKKKKIRALVSSAQHLPFVSTLCFDVELLSSPKKIPLALEPLSEYRTQSLFNKKSECCILWRNRQGLKWRIREARKTFTFEWKRRWSRFVAQRLNPFFVVFWLKQKNRNSTSSRFSPSSPLRKKNKNETTFANPQNSPNI